MAYKILTDEKVTRIKQLIWEGWSHPKIAAMFHISVSYISQMATGVRYGYIRWPDGSMGRLPMERKEWISFRRNKTMHFDLAVDPTQTITGLPATPSDDPERDAYLQRLARESIEEVEQAAREERERQEALEAEARKRKPKGKRPKTAEEMYKDWVPDPIPFDEVAELHPDNHFVIKAQDEDDHNLKIALGEMLKLVGPQQWTEKNVTKMVRAVEIALSGK